MEETTHNLNRRWHALQRSLAQAEQPLPKGGVIASYRRVHGMSLARGLQVPANTWLSRKQA